MTERKGGSDVGEEINYLDTLFTDSNEYLFSEHRTVRETDCLQPVAEKDMVLCG